MSIYSSAASDAVFACKYSGKERKKTMFITFEEYETPIAAITDNRIIHHIERAAARQYGWLMVDRIMKIIGSKSIREAAAAFDCLSCFRILH